MQNTVEKISLLIFTSWLSQMSKRLITLSTCVVKKSRVISNDLMVLVVLRNCLKSGLFLGKSDDFHVFMVKET